MKACGSVYAYVYDLMRAAHASVDRISGERVRCHGLRCGMGQRLRLVQSSNEDRGAVGAGCQ